MDTQDITSFMDLLDLDEEMVDTRLKSLMTRDTHTNKHLKNTIQLLQYKQLINSQEGTECENEEEFTFLVKLINQLNTENATIICKITALVLDLNRSSLINKSEHLLQQILSDVTITSDKTSHEDFSLIVLKLCDTVLDAVIKISETVILRFVEIPVSSILSSSDEKMKAHFLTSTIPKLIKGVQGFNILDTIWTFVKEIANENNEMSLKILSCLSEYYIPVADKHGKVSYESEVVYLVDFWNIILCGLCNDDPMRRKLSMYLGKRGIDCLTAGKRDVNLSSENKIISWNCSKATALKIDWDNFFILIDSLEEKQSNIVLPSLHLFEKVNTLETCWLNCPFKLGLRHDNTQVRLKTMTYKLNTSIHSLNEAVILLEAVNDNNIFDDVLDHEELKLKMTNFFSNQQVLNYILKALIMVKWAPVPLYHVSNILSKLNLKGFQQENLASILNEILKIPCNNVPLRKAAHVNIFYFILNSCHINWRDFVSLLPQFQAKLPSKQLVSIIISTLENDTEKLQFLKSMSDFNSNYDNGELLIIFIENQLESLPILSDILHEKGRKVQDIVNRQYSDKKECFTDAVSLALLYSKLKTKGSPNAVTLLKTLTQEIKIVLQYFLSLVSSDVTFEIEEIVLISKVAKIIECDDLRDILLQLYKISVLLFTDDRSNLDKTLLGLYNICSLRKNVILLTHYKHEMISLQHLLKWRSLDNKQNSRLVNAFYEKLCEIIFDIITEDEKHANSKDILEFVEKVTECGGYGCLYWILKITNEMLPILNMEKNKDFDVTQFVHRMWKEIEELKSNHQYNPCMEEFINMIIQPCLIDQPMYNNILTLYCGKIIEYAALKNTPLYYLVRKLMSIEINVDRGHLVYILCEILMYFPVPRKDQRITDNLMIDILQNPKYEELWKDTSTHFNFEIQYSAISMLRRIEHIEIYHTIISYITNKIDNIFKNKLRYHGNSQAHRTLLIGLQHLLYIASLKPGLDLVSVNDWSVQLLAKLPHQPSVKLCLEWFIALFYYRKGVEINHEFVEHLNAKKVPVTSQFTIIYYIMKRKCKSDCKEREYNFVLNHLLSNTMGPIYNVRLYAQCIARQLNMIKESPNHSNMMKIVDQNCAKDKNCTKLEEDLFISYFDIVSELKTSFIYHFVLNYTETNYEKVHLELIREVLRDNEVNTGGQLTDDDIFNYDYPKSNTKVSDSVDGAGSIQKKYVPWRNMSDVDVYTADKKKETTSGLILVASLVDKLPNLGGMARTSEVFGVRTYVVDSLRHLQDQQFQSLSVSAERWVDIEEVRPGHRLKEYLQRKKQEGYTIVAAEQTSTSCSLERFKFPHKTVLLLGHEKEGIPCDLLPLTDHCVEVPQQGLVRSLNVHVTAAIFVWEYTRQHVLTS